MPRDQQRLADYLGHIAEAIERIYEDKPVSPMFV